MFKTLKLFLASLLIFANISTVAYSAPIAAVLNDIAKRDVQTHGTLLGAINRIGTSDGIVEVSTIQIISSNLTIPKNVTLKFTCAPARRVCGRIDPSSGITVTINGPIQAPLRQIFSGAGAVTIGVSGLQRNLISSWWVDFSSAVADIGSTINTLIIPSVQVVAANVTAPSTLTLQFIGTGRLDPTTGVLVTILGPVLSAGTTASISGGTGTVALGSQSINTSDSSISASANNTFTGTNNFTGGDLTLRNAFDVNIEQGGGFKLLRSAGDTAIAFFLGPNLNQGIFKSFANPDPHTILQIDAPSGALGSAESQESTLVLFRGSGANTEFLDLYNNGYPSETQFGIRIQKRGTGVFRNFVFDKDDGTTKTRLMTIDTTNDRVGVGVASPGAPLDVESDPTALGIQIRGRITSDLGSLRFMNNAGTVELSRIEGEATDSLSFSTGAAVAERMRINASGDIGIGINLPVAKLHVDQSSLSGAKPVIILDQADIDDTFINFSGTSAADGTRSISSSTTSTSAKFGAIRIEINGVTKWIRVYDTEN